MKTKFQYTGIRVKNLQRSITFYTKLLGMKLVWRMKIPETNGEIAYLKTDGSNQLLELNFYKDNKVYKHGDEIDHLAFEVNNLDTALSLLAKRGVKRIYRIVKSKKSRWTYVKDPDGIWIELIDHRP
jgi:lactoylglutathione lyase